MAGQTDDARGVADEFSIQSQRGGQTAGVLLKPPGQQPGKLIDIELAQQVIECAAAAPHRCGVPANKGIPVFEPVSRRAPQEQSDPFAAGFRNRPKRVACGAALAHVMECSGQRLETRRF